MVMPPEHKEEEKQPPSSGAGGPAPARRARSWTLELDEQLIDDFRERMRKKQVAKKWLKMPHVLRSPIVKKATLAVRKLQAARRRRRLTLRGRDW